ncbi:hypothetical protein F0562_010547 [Nyssa sinensis]|uniref:FYVE-type domain-containing protein n=1 Tax=Nyssa sinensis TaxID=561372 RepID=A0A5J5A2L7_9ASTE|nr:hypothetical protein F0562_010547 [Nyssa sinensis]
MDARVQYPKIQLDDYEPKPFSRTFPGGVEEQRKDSDLVATPNFVNTEKIQVLDNETEALEGLSEENDSNAGHQTPGKYFYYDPPLSEETGVWIPVSVPPMSKTEREEWNRGFSLNGGQFPDGDMDWNQFIGEDKEMTMWDVVLDMLLVGRGKVSALASGDLHGCRISWMSNNLLEQAWKEMAQTLTEANFGNIQEILEAEPPKWLADSAASACMLCNVRFHPIMCSRHHCRFCGGIFCNDCSKGRSLLPAKFRTGDPQRVCDVCCVRLESVQSYLMDQVSRAAQLPTHDLTDLSTLRSWLNIPWGQSLEYEIYKATNTIKGYSQVGSLTPEKSIPDAILKQARGLAILTVAKVGVMVTYNIGTGLVVARREDGSWSPPSAISSFGIGWGAQAGGELTDFIIVLRTNNAVKTFSGNMHFSVGAGLSAAVGIVGRAAEADLRAGDGGYAACYTYSCSKGAFVGCSLEGSIVTTRTQENSRFYGNPSISASDILLGLLPRPPAAAILYHALSDLYQKLER